MEYPESNDTVHSVELRHLQLSDYRSLKEAMIEAYSELNGDYWEIESISTLLTLFPEGQLCVIVDGRIAATALSLIIDYSKYGDTHTYAQITGNYTFDTHDPHGDVLYGIEVFVHPDFRGLRLGRRLYDARKELCESLNLRAIMLGGRIPNYSKHAHELNPRQYIEKVKNKELYDPVLWFQLSNGFHVKKILKGYLLEDSQSQEYATLLQWDNIFYDKEEKLINVDKKVVRVGVVQWQMRIFPSFDSLIEQIEYFVDSVAAYQADFALLPEFFNAPLMAEFDHLGAAAAIRKLAEFTAPILQKCKEFAVSYNVNIISGSMPIIEDGQLLNISYLCRRDGTHEMYKKIHVTPSEVSSWGMSGGTQIKTFETDCGPVGILICYDVEFPELCRLYAKQGMKILFVPFLTDTQNGYYRIRRCAQARAIENECYVAIAGSVGNLPKVNNMDIQYAQSAVFTPSDFAFPSNGVKAEATPNTEMTLIADLDMDLLKELHQFGSVRNLKDRRTDLYEVRLKK